MTTPSTRDSVLASDTDPITSAIYGLRAAITETRLGVGGLAELRRGFKRDSGSAAFWRLLQEHVSESGVHVSPQHEDDWMLVIAGMAKMAPLHHGPTPFGRALAITKYPWARVRTLLSLDPGTDRFRDAVGSAIRWLARESHPVDWRELTGFILTRDPDVLTVYRRTVARAFISQHDADQS